MKSGNGGYMVEKNSGEQKTTGRLPKFIKKKILGKPSKPLTDDRWKEFLGNQNGPGKEQSLELWHFLLEKEKASEYGGVIYLDILDHMKNKFSMSRSRVDTLMREMNKWHIVKKQIRKIPSEKTINKNRIFYQICGDAWTPVFTSEGMVKDYPRLYRENIVLKNKLEYAKCLLEIHGLIEEYDAEMKRRNEVNEQWKHMSRDEINRKIRNESPEKYQDYKTKLEHDRKYYLKCDLEKMKEEKT